MFQDNLKATSKIFFKLNLDLNKTSSCATVSYLHRELNVLISPIQFRPDVHR